MNYDKIIYNELQNYKFKKYAPIPLAENFNFHLLTIQQVVN